MIIGGPMVVVDKSHFDAYSFNLLFWKIKNTKSQYDTDLEGSEAIKGVRYRDDDRIARMVLGYIFTECGFDPSYANKKFISLLKNKIFIILLLILAEKIKKGFIT